MAHRLEAIYYHGNGMIYFREDNPLAVLDYELIQY